jgi:hypothetical protein
MWTVVASALAANAGCTWSLDAQHMHANSGPKWFQAFWEPCGRCWHKDRIGTMSDGGKWACLDTPIAGSAVISIGSNNVFDFEYDLLNNYGIANVHIYDPTSNPPAEMPPTIVYYKEWASAALLPTMLTRAPNTSIFKIDCEGCEFELFTLANLHMLHKAQIQILVEVHWEGGIMVDLWRRFESAGYTAFHKEPNIAWSDGSCVEYAMLPTRV